METLTETEVARPEAATETRQFAMPVIAAKTSWMDRQVLSFEKARWGWMAMMITIQSCIGSIACMFISYNHGHTALLATCAALSMGSNALFIALAPARLCIIGFYLSVLVNTILILTNI